MTWRDFVDVDLVAKNRRDLAEYLRFNNRFPNEEDQLEIKRHLRRLAGDAVVVHFDDPQQATGILKKGRFYSAREQGWVLPELAVSRQRTETTLFGARSVGTPDIIYALLGATKSFGYGNVAIRLRDRVKLRSTVTRKDSLNAMTASDFDPVGGLCVANGLDELDCLCVPLRSREEVISATRIEDLAANSYFEVQIHGSVSTDDIESISIPRSGNTRELEEWASNRGIIIEGH